MSTNAVHRNRVIYQSEALFISPDATGYHYTGQGGYGMATPPLSINDDGQGIYDNGKIHGWNVEDDNLVQNWPAWNPDCELVYVKAGFDSVEEIENGTGTVKFTVDVGVNGTVGDGTPIAQRAAGDVFIAADPQAVADPALVNTPMPLQTVDQLVATFNAVNPGGPTLSVVQGGNLILPEPNQNIAGIQAPAVYSTQNGVDEDAATAQNTILTDGIGGSVNITFVASVAGSAGNAINLTFDGVQTVNDAIAAWNGPNGGNPITLPGANGLFVPEATDAGSATNVVVFSGGEDNVQSSFLGTNLAILNDTGRVTLKGFGDTSGANGNNIIIGNPAGTASAALKDVDQLVNDWNTANADNQVEVLAGGDHVPDAGVMMQLHGGKDPQACSHGTIIQQLKRIQTVNYGFTVNRTDINQLGHLSRLDSIVIDAPTVNLDFTYYLLDGWNERQLEFNTDGITNSLSGALSPELYQGGNNYFLLTVPEARDAVNGDKRLDSNGKGDQKSVISIGNGFLTDYSVDLSVGSIPTVSCTVEGMNIQSELDQTGLNLPSVDMVDGSKLSDAWDFSSNDSKTPKANGCTGLFSLPGAISGYDGCGDVAALRPSDIWIDIQGQSLIAETPSGDVKKPQLGSAHIQSATISVPMARTTLQRLGSTFGFSKALDVPVTTTLNVSAIMSEVKQGNLMDLLCACETSDITISIHDPECAACEMKTGAPAMRFIFKGARLESENFSASIGDNKTVDMSFSVQAGGADDMAKGIYISGKESLEFRPGTTTPNKGVPPGWTGVDGSVNVPVNATNAAKVNKLTQGMQDFVSSLSTAEKEKATILGYRA